MVKRTVKTVEAVAQDESGATAIEYGFLVTGIALAIIAGLNSLGVELQDLFTTIAGTL